jgi:adenylate cyclase class 2
MSAILEREIKLPFDNVGAARAAVRTLGATPLRPRRLQSDVVFDSRDRAMSARGEVLRVRVEEGAHLMTHKRPVADATMKLREEIETSVGDGELFITILTKLGFIVSYRYEKYREEFALDDVVIAVDETPIGVFVEIEGTDTGIMAAATALGRGPDDFVTESYRTLFVQACIAGGVAPTNMIFRSTNDR